MTTRNTTPDDVWELLAAAATQARPDWAVDYLEPSQREGMWIGPQRHSAAGPEVRIESNRLHDGSIHYAANVSCTPATVVAAVAAATDTSSVLQHVPAGETLAATLQRVLDAAVATGKWQPCFSHDSDGVGQFGLEDPTRSVLLYTDVDTVAKGDTGLTDSRVELLAFTPEQIAALLPVIGADQ